MAEMNRQFLLNARPVGEVKLSDLRYHETAVIEPGDGEFLVEMQYLAVEPAMRGWMENRGGYMAPLEIGDVMRSFGLGEVVQSRHPQFAVGDRVSGTFGMQTHALANGADSPVSLVDPDIESATYLGVLGVTGLTAYCGMTAIGKPEAGETVLVSGAAGATGSVVGQMAKLAGCRVIGIAGSQVKCDWLSRLGFDEVINYKTEDVDQRIKRLCPNGVDVYWDNVGGDLLDVALNHLAMGARVVICGGISRYNATGPVPGPQNYFNLVFRNALMQGFVVSHYRKMFPEAVQFLKEKLRAGQLQHHEDILDGFEQTPVALQRLFRGENLGKQLVRV